MSALNFSLSRKEEPTWWSTTSFNEGSLNTDLALILGAMVCVLISALGLISLLRLARYYSRRTGAESSDGVAIQLVNTELKKAAIKALPVVVYTSASKMPPELATDCPICLYEFKEREKVRVLPDCNHGFHMECIDKWLISNSSCPMCRHSPNLFSRNMKPEGAAIAQDTELSNAIHVVIETTDSTRAIPGSTQALERNPQEATGATTTLPLPTSSVSENGSSPDPMNNVV